MSRIQRIYPHILSSRSPYLRQYLVSAQSICGRYQSSFAASALVSDVNAKDLSVGNPSPSFKPSPSASSQSSSSSSSSLPKSHSFISRISSIFGSSSTFTKPTKFTGKATTWSQAVSEAECLILPHVGKISNPMDLLGKDISSLTDNIKKLLNSGHPLLNRISKYYFDQSGKHIRPLIVLLVSQATNLAPKKQYPSSPSNSSSQTYEYIDTPVSPPLFQDNIVSSSTNYSIKPDTHILPTQRRLAEITEMIHTASLLHDDVIDNSDTRRNIPSVNAQFGNKMAILAGDYLLARASVALARLRNVEVVELLATVIANLVEGEFMQLKNTDKNQMSTFEYYMEKTYMKTASLIAKSCRAATVLGGCSDEVAQIAYDYGKNLGLAFQLVDDMLDFTVSSDEFGKPVGADLQLGLATAPVLYAAEEYPELRRMIERRFKNEGDVERAREMVHASNGLSYTRNLASSHCQKAINAIMQLPPSQARDALVQLTSKVLDRTK